MSFKATHRFARISARKVRPLADMIRGKFADEALAAQHARQVRRHDLDRHVAAVLGVAGPVHGRHAATTQLARQLVAVAEYLLQRTQQVVHGFLLCGKAQAYGTARMASREFVRLSIRRRDPTPG